jgi:putative membrane protein
VLRFLASIVLHLLANAVGLLIAAAILDGFSVTAPAFIAVVVVFTVIEVVLEPLIISISLRYAPVLRGGSALVVTLVGLIVTTLVSDGLVIEGLTAWVVGTLIVWLGAVIAGLLLPLVLFKKAMQGGKEQRG